MRFLRRSNRKSYKDRVFEAQKAIVESSSFMKPMVVTRPDDWVPWHTETVLPKAKPVQVVDGVPRGKSGRPIKIVRKELARRARQQYEVAADLINGYGLLICRNENPAHYHLIQDGQTLNIWPSTCRTFPEQRLLPSTFDLFDLVDLARSNGIDFGTHGFRVSVPAKPLAKEKQEDNAGNMAVGAMRTVANELEAELRFSLLDIG